MTRPAKDFSRAEILAILVTALILLLAFGALVAAILPVVLALTAFVAATGLVFITSNVFPIDHSTFSVMLLIGLAVGVHYSLFYIRREREERAAGRSAGAALQATAATSGRFVLISGLTVIVAVAGMFFTGAGELRGIAAGTMIVVATSALGSVTMLPALLSKLGDRIKMGRVPLAHPLRVRNRESRFWNALLTPVLRRPAIAAIGATTLLLALAIPALQLHTVQPGPPTTRRRCRSCRPRPASRTRSPAAMPAQIVVKADNIGTPVIRGALTRFRTRALAAGLVHDPISVHVIDRHVAIISAPLAGTGKDTQSNQAPQQLRSETIPATLGETAGVRRSPLGATMKLLGDWNWWLPRRLHWLPELNPRSSLCNRHRRRDQPLRHKTIPQFSAGADQSRRRQHAFRETAPHGSRDNNSGA